MASLNENIAIDEALTFYFERLDEGQPIEVAALVERFPECAAELREFFAHEQYLHEKLQAFSSQIGSLQSGSGGRLTIRCPSCQQPNSVAADAPFTDMFCESCGSRFGIVNPADDATGSTALITLGRFELTERLGMGSYGTVWKAHDKELQRTVAVKIPRQSGMSPEDQEKFFREARAAAQLMHPNIVSVYEVGRSGHSLYIVSEFIRGHTLASWLVDQRPTGREAAELCAKIADALQHAHEKGVVHRDLKPANIMLDESGEPHIMDFGLARREAGEVTVTLDGHVLGTPAFMSPEQAEGKAHSADSRSDVYSLGVILFQLLTGELPFRGNPRMMLHQVIHDEPPSPRSFNANIKRDLETITLKCLEKDPAKRYQTSRALADELRRFLAGEAIHARPIGRIARGWRWVKRKPAIAALSAIAVTLLFGTVTVLAVSNALILRESADKDAALHAREIALDEKNSALKLATTNAEMAHRRYYAAQMNLAAQAWHNGQHARTVQLLETLRPNKDEQDMRGFEWRHLYHLSHANVVRRFKAQNANSNSPVTDIIWPTMGKWFASASRGNEVRIWNGDTGALEGILENKPRYHIWDLAASPDGQLIAAGLANGEVVLWDVPSKREIRRWMAHPKWEAGTYAVAISPDKKFVVSGARGIRHSKSCYSLALWDIEGNRLPVFKDVTQNVGRLAFSPDGTVLAAASFDYDAKSISFWRMTGQPKLLGELNNIGVYEMVFSADGKTLWGPYYSSIHKIDVESIAQLRTHFDFDNQILSIAEFPDQNKIASTTRDRTILLMDSQTEKSTIVGAEQSIANTLAVSPTGRKIVTGDSEGWITLRDLDLPPPIPTMEHNWIAEGKNGINSIAYSPDGKLLYVGNSPLNIVDAETLELKRSAGIRDAQVLAISSDCNYAALYYKADGKLDILNLPNDTVKTSLNVGEISRALFSPDSQSLATWKIWKDNAVKIWDVQTGSCYAKLTDSKKNLIKTFSFAPHGYFAAISGQFTAASTLNYKSNNAVISEANAVAHYGHVGTSSVEYSRDGKLLALGFATGSISLWNVDPTSGKITFNRNLLGHTQDILDMTFSPDCTQLVTASRDRSVRVWDVALGQETITFDIHAKLLAFSPDGDRLAIVGANSLVQILKASKLESARQTK